MLTMLLPPTGITGLKILVVLLVPLPLLLQSTEDLTALSPELPDSLLFTGLPQLWPLLVQPLQLAELLILLLWISELLVLELTS